MKINLKYHILISNLLEILSIAVLVSPVFFMHYNIKIITYGYLPLEFISIFLLLRYNKWDIKINRYIVFIFCMEMFVLILTIINHRLSYSYLCMIVATLFLTAFIVTNIKDNGRKLIFLFEHALCLLFILDVISILLCIFTGKHTNDSYGLVGHKNYHAFLFILTLGFKMINKRLNEKKLVNIEIFIIAFVSIILEVVVDSMSGAVSVILLSVASFLISKKKLKLPSLTTITMGLLILNYILIFAINSTQWMQRLLVLMGRDAGMTGRSQMWTYALDLIARNPAYGYGYSQTVQVWSVAENTFVSNHCHNFFLNLVLTGGIPYFVVVMSFIFIVTNRIRKNKDELMNILTYMIGCYLLLGVSEIIVNVNTMFWPLLTFGFYAQHLFRNSRRGIIEPSDELRIYYGNKKVSY